MPNGKRTCFVDTNLLIYALDSREAEKRARVVAVLNAVRHDHRLVLSPQSLAECYWTLIRKGFGMAEADARRYVVALSPWCTTTTDVSTLTRAWAICDETGYQWWDCLLLASAVGAACDLFLTEDLQHNRRIAGLRIVDPFRSASLNDIMG